MRECLEVDVASQGESEEEALELYFEPRRQPAHPPCAKSSDVLKRLASWKPVRRPATSNSCDVVDTVIVPKKHEIPVGTLRSILSQAHISPDDWEQLA